MKKIKVKKEYQPFLAFLDGSTKIELNHDWVSIADGAADSINTRWGSLVDIEEMSLEEAIPHIQAESIDLEKQVDEDVKPKRKVAKKKDD